MRDSTGTHGARLQRHPQVEPVKAVLTKAVHRSLDGQNFGMMQRIAIRPHAVAGLGNNGATGIGHGGGHRHLAKRGGSGGFLKQMLHDVGTWRWYGHARVFA